MARDDELITATITVPRRVWPAVLEFVAKRMAENGSATAETAGPADKGESDGDEAAEPYTVDDVVRAANARAKKVYQMLAASAGNPVSIDDLSEAVGFTTVQTPGLLGSMGRSIWSRDFRTGWRTPDGVWSWNDYGNPKLVEGRTPPDNLVWGWDTENRTLTMPEGIAPKFIEALG